jgi:hypothetical protein
VEEEVRGAIIGGDEPKALCVVEPLHPPCPHNSHSLTYSIALVLVCVS